MDAFSDDYEPKTIVGRDTEKQAIADYLDRSITKRGRLGTGLFDVERRLRGRAPRRTSRRGHATVDVSKEDFMKVYRFIRRVGLFSSVDDFYETAAMNLILGIWDPREAEKWRIRLSNQSTRAREEAQGCMGPPFQFWWGRIVYRVRSIDRRDSL